MPVCAGSWNLSLRKLLLNREIECGGAPLPFQAGSALCNVMRWASGCSGVVGVLISPVQK